MLEAGEDPSLREVARRAGVSQAAPYHHFESKSGLMAALAHDGFCELERKLLAAGRGAEPRLGKLVKAYVRFALAHPHHYRLMFSPDLSDDPALQDVARRTFALLVKAVGEVRSDNVLARAREAWALAHGIVQLTVNGGWKELGGPSSPARVAAETSRAVVTLVSG